MKKFISMLLCLALVCALIPAAFADDAKTCDVCGKSAEKLEKLACGEHSACETCAKRTQFIPLERHTKALPCGKFECDGGDHYRLPNAFCPDTDKPHFKCEDKDAEHTCAHCGKTFNCAQDVANCHTQCRVCKGYFCDGGYHCSTYDPIVGDYVCEFPNEYGELFIYRLVDGNGCTLFNWTILGNEITTEYAR